MTAVTPLEPETLLEPAAIAATVERLAAEITAEHPDGVVLVGVLKGASIFLADLARAIREVDGKHLLFVERVNSIGDDWSSDGDMNFFLVPDENTAYEFHFYSPIEYTHQQTSWTTYGEGGQYPDESRLGEIKERWINVATFDSPKVPEGDSDWSYYESPPLKPSAPSIAVGKPALVARAIVPPVMRCNKMRMNVRSRTQ